MMPGVTLAGVPVADLDALAADFWEWRAAEQPRSHDDIGWTFADEASRPKWMLATA